MQTVSVFDQMCGVLQLEGAGQMPGWGIASCSAGSAALAAWFTHPADVVKTRLQVSVALLLPRCSPAYIHSATVQSKCASKAYCSSKIPIPFGGVSLIFHFCLLFEPKLSGGLCALLVVRHSGLGYSPSHAACKTRASAVRLTSSLN